jgi:hypothetical protein
LPNPVLVQIADALIAKSVLAGYKSTGLLNDVGKDWLQEDNPPAAYLGDAGERNEYKPTASISPRAGVFFLSIVRGDNPTRLFWPLYKALKDAISIDPTLGGLATGDNGAMVTGYFSDKTIQAVTARVHRAEIFVEVEYRHDRGNA